MLLIGFSTFGQDTVSKVIIIDTITFDKGIPVDKEDYSPFLKNVGNEYVAFENNWIRDAYPALCVKVKCLTKQECAIGLPLDNQSGRLEFHHLENLGDTIHITRYRIFNNCLFDSFKTSLSYYHRFNDSTSVLYKNKTKVNLPKKGCDTLKELALIINGEPYLVPLTFSKDINTAIYCKGFARKRDERRSNGYEHLGKRRNKRIKFNYFSGSTTAYRYKYEGAIYFK